MPPIFLVMCIFIRLSLSLQAEVSHPLRNHTEEWYNREDHDGFSSNGTTEEFKDNNKTTSIALNRTKTYVLHLSTSTIGSANFDDGSNTTQKSNTFIVSRLLEYSAFSWLKNEYVMSIVIPIAAGIGSGIVLIILINMWKCARAKCQRGCHKKNRNLPKHIKQMKLADRMKLLEESSDEEF